MKRLPLIVLFGFACSLGLMAEDTIKKPEPGKDKSEVKRAPLNVLTQPELAKLLSRRVQGGLGHTFAQFANMFMVSSHLGTGTCVGLTTADETVAKTELQDAFPHFYKPTLSELLDAIALQTFSKWSYETKDQFVSTTTTDAAKPNDGVVIISFSRFIPGKPRTKPFSVTPAKGWTHEDRGNWETYIPAVAPVGMDIYEMGQYSTKKRDGQAALMNRVRREMSLDWAHRVKPDAAEGDLKPAQVGKFEALHFDSMVPANDGRKVHWRQWVMTAGDRCYFIISTLFPDQEEQLLPDVEQMLRTFALSEH